MLPILLWNATEKCSRCTRTRTPFLSINLPIGANVIPRVRNSLQSTRRALDSRWGYRTVPVASKVSSTLCLLFLMALATSCISIAASLSSKISQACELSQAGLSLSLSLSISLYSSVCVYLPPFSTKPMNLSALCRNKMKQTELGEVIGTLCQERGEKGEELGRNGYARCLTNEHRFRAPLGGIT